MMVRNQFFIVIILNCLTFLFSGGVASGGVPGPLCNDVPFNPITNCGFETRDFTGWVAQDMAVPHVPLSVRETGDPIDTFDTAPTEGTYAAVNGFDGGGPDTIKLGQDVDLPSRADKLTFDYRAYPRGGAPESLLRTFTVTIEPAGGGTPLQSDLILSASFNVDTRHLTGSVDISQFGGQTVRVSFNWYIPEDHTGPGSFQLDNIAVTSSPFPWPMFMPAIKKNASP